MNEDVFAILHDGVITGVEGDCPGGPTLFVSSFVSLFIRCDYLRSRFSAPGEHFEVRLKNCRHCYFQSEIGARTADLGKLSALHLALLSAETTSDEVLVYTGQGVLHLAFESLSVWLNDSTRVRVDELERAAESYWDDWSKRSPAPPPV